MRDAVAGASDQSKKMRAGMTSRTTSDGPFHMKRSAPLRRLTPLKRITRLRPMSKKRARRVRDEKPWRDAYLKDHPICEAGTAWQELADSLPFGNDRMIAQRAALRCTLVAVELHEKRKRSRLGSTTDPSNLTRICRLCHMATEDYSALATRAGLLISGGE